MSEKHSSPRSPAWRMWQPAVKLGTAGRTLSVLGGCFGDSIVKHSPGDTYGEILVSPPRVASRQRLVEDRLEQEKWLRSQLNKEIDVSSAQGKSDLRSAVSLALGAQVNFDPLQMPVFAAQQKKSLDDTTRANELESLKFQLEQKRLKATLDQAASETDPAKIAAPYADSANANTPTASSAGKPSVDFSKLTDTLNTMSSRIDALDKRTLPSQIASVVIGIVAVALGYLFEKQNVAFKVGLAFSVAASINFPVLLMSMFFKDMTTRGAVIGGLIGLVLSVSLVILSKTVWEDVIGMPKGSAPFPLTIPALVSMTAAFLGIYIFYKLDNSEQAKKDRAGYDAQMVRSETGIGIAKASAH